MIYLGKGTSPYFTYISKRLPVDCDSKVSKLSTLFITSKITLLLILKVDPIFGALDDENIASHFLSDSFLWKSNSIFPPVSFVILILAGITLVSLSINRSLGFRISNKLQN